VKQYAEPKGEEAQSTAVRRFDTPPGRQAPTSTIHEQPVGRGKAEQEQLELMTAFGHVVRKR
jgi:hypothetical protein